VQTNKRIETIRKGGRVMNILRKVNLHDGIESEMQEDVARLILEDRLWDGENTRKLYMEVPCPQVGRRSDIVLSAGKRTKYYNVECKIVDVKKVIEQAKDHLRWADYSYICLKANTYIPQYRIKDMLEFNIGLLLWNPGVIMECVPSGKSEYINTELRKGIIETIEMLKPFNPLPRDKE
jgi:hypothetical protein